MASKRTKNRLYWALVNAVSDKDEDAVEALECWYIEALRGSVTDSMILSDREVQTHLSALEELHGPAGAKQVWRPRERWVRQYVDDLRGMYEPT